MTISHSCSHETIRSARESERYALHNGGDRDVSNSTNEQLFHSHVLIQPPRDMVDKEIGGGPLAIVTVAKPFTQRLESTLRSNTNQLGT